MRRRSGEEGRRKWGTGHDSCSNKKKLTLPGKVGVPGVTSCDSYPVGVVYHVMFKMDLKGAIYHTGTDSGEQHVSP